MIFSRRAPPHRYVTADGWQAYEFHIGREIIKVVTLRPTATSLIVEVEMGSGPARLFQSRAEVPCPEGYDLNEHRDGLTVIAFRSALTPEMRHRF